MLELFGALHPPFVSFPFVLVTISFLFQLIGVYKNKNSILIASKSFITAALVFAILSYYSGHEASEKVNQTFTVADSLVGQHYLWAKIFLFTLIPCVLFGWIAFQAKFNKAIFESIFLVLLLFCLCLVIYTSWLGGSLVFDHGAGVRAPMSNTR
ncbi:MAG: DUF2231 domain-containing protein [bacterium]|nr:DUF2231 domain-containing protein [bacterium]